MIESVELMIVSLLCLGAVFVPLEWVVPAWFGQRRLRPRVLTDLAFFTGQYLVFGAAVTFVLGRLVVFFADAPALVEPTELGIHEPHPRTYLGLLVHPLRPRRRSPTSSR